MSEHDERRSVRSRAVLMAVIESDKKRFAVRVSDVSARSALIVGAALPPAEAQVRFQFDDVSIHGRVVWSRDGAAAISFDEPVNPQQLWSGMRRPLFAQAPLV